MSASVVFGSAQRTIARCTPVVSQVRHAGIRAITKVSKDQSILRSSGTQRMASRRVSVTAMASGSDAGLKIDLRGMWDIVVILCEIEWHLIYCCFIL